MAKGLSVMNPLMSLLQNAAIYTFSNILNAAIPFMLLPILTRVLLPADYGVLAMFNAAVGGLAAFTGLCVQTVVNLRFVDRDEIDFPRYVGSCLCILMVSTLVTLGVVAFFLKPLSSFSGIPPFWLLMAVVISGCNFLIQIRLGIWLMAKKPVVYGFFQVSLSLLNISVSLVLVLLLKYGYEGRLYGQMFAVLLFAMIGLLSLRMEGRVSFSPRWEYLREALNFGIPLLPHVFGSFLAGVADRFIINKHLGLDATGIYMVAVQLGLGMWLVSEAFNKAFLPWLLEQLKSGDIVAKRRIVKVTWFYCVVTLVIAGVVALLSYWIIFFIAGSMYVSAAKAFAWIALGQAFVGMYFMMMNYIYYSRQTMWFAWSTFFSGCVGITLAWLFIPVFGIIGAGLSFAITMALRFFMTWIIASKVCPMPWFFFLKR